MAMILGEDYGLSSVAPPHGLLLANTVADREADS
jgi:hypothetical protein